MQLVGKTTVELAKPRTARELQYFKKYNVAEELVPFYDTDLSLVVNDSFFFSNTIEKKSYSRERRLEGR